MDKKKQREPKEARKNKGEHRQFSHQFEPVFDADSRVLILGTFPSVKSREMQFYYGHPQNRFWRIIAYLAESEVPQTIE